MPHPKHARQQVPRQATAPYRDKTRRPATRPEGVSLPAPSFAFIRVFSGQLPLSLGALGALGVLAAPQDRPPKTGHAGSEPRASASALPCKLPDTRQNTTLRDTTQARSP